MAGRAYRMKYRQRSYVCNDPRCGRRFYKSHVSASIKMPHCPHCGSSVTETKASVERRLGKQLQSDKISRHDYKPYNLFGLQKKVQVTCRPQTAYRGKPS